MYVHCHLVELELTFCIYMRNIILIQMLITGLKLVNLDLVNHWSLALWNSRLSLLIQLF